MEYLVMIMVCMLCANVHAEPLVDTAYGTLEGSSEINADGLPYDVFRGIPFAEPPLGDLRFRRPQAPSSWEGVRPAKEDGYKCIQFLLNTNTTSEDCLYLNVYVPGGVEEASDLPVMAWVHGGGYFFGSGSHYDSEELIMYGPVIVVTVNYRLGPIGFLSTEDDASLGNYGLWDVHAALVWIQDNIAGFGGDPDRVTLFGQSAGAALTSHAVISPPFNGLMHRAISLSGASSGFFGLTYPGEGAASTDTLAFSVGCRRMNNTEELVECLRGVDANELDRKGFFGIATIRRRLPNFIPVIDGDLIPQFPRESWEQGVGNDIDLLTGFAEHDAAAFITGNLVGNISFNLAATHATLRLAMGLVIGMYPEPSAGMDALYGRYKGMSDNDTDTRTIATTQAMTDWWFGSGSSQEAHLHASTSAGQSSTYQYNFNYRMSFLELPEEWIAGQHSGDLWAVFGEAYQTDQREERGWYYNDEDRAVTDHIMAYYTNFATTGDPNVGPSAVPEYWPAFSDGSPQLLRFQATPSVETENTERKADYDFWNDEFPAIVRPEEDGIFGDDEEDRLTEAELMMMMEESLQVLRERVGKLGRNNVY